MSKRVFLVQEPDQSDEWVSQEAHGFADAAEDFAELADQNSGGEFQDGSVLLVKDAPDGTPKRFVIGVAYSKNFAAYERPVPAGTTIVNDGRAV